MLSLFRKGGLDVPMMIAFNLLAGVNGVAWATPAADLLALLIAVALFLLYRRRILLTP
jgi:Na+-driven multidrug efflux pump